MILSDHPAALLGRHRPSHRRGRLRAAAVLAAACVGALLVSAEPAAAAQTGVHAEWKPRPSMQHARTGLGVAGTGGQLFAIGGFNGTEVLGTAESRSSAGAGTWRDVPALPTPRSNLGVAALGGLVYAIGGFGLDDVSSAVEAYNPVSRHWAERRGLPQPLGSPGVAALDGLLYVAGGVATLPDGNFQAQRSLLVYQPHTNTWRSAAPMATARADLRLVASGHYLYAIGGSNDAGASLAVVERYSPGTNSWTTLRSLTESRLLTCAVATTVGQRPVLVVVGGMEDDAGGNFVQNRTSTEVFDIRTGRWVLLAVQLPAPRVAHDCAVDATGAVLVIGGATGPGARVAEVDALVGLSRECARFA